MTKDTATINRPEGETRPHNLSMRRGVPIFLPLVKILYDKEKLLPCVRFNQDVVPNS